MRIFLSQFRHPDDRLERETVGSEGELIVQSAKLNSSIRLSIGTAVQADATSSVFN